MIVVTPSALDRRSSDVALEPASELADYDDAVGLLSRHDLQSDSSDAGSPLDRPNDPGASHVLGRSCVDDATGSHDDRRWRTPTGALLRDRDRASVWILR